MEINESGDIKFTDEEFTKLNNMIKGISWRYNNWSNLEAEDIEMELWLKSLEVIKYTKEINYNLIAKCCYNRAIDLCRFAKKNNEQSFSASDLLEVFGNGNTDDDNTDCDGLYNTCTEDDNISSLSIQEMIELFDPGSKERKYIILVALWLGLDENIYGNDKNPKFNKLFGNDRMELEIAKKLKFANDTSNGYRSLKIRVRNKLKECGFKL